MGPDERYTETKSSRKSRHYQDDIKDVISTPTDDTENRKKSSRKTDKEHKHEGTEDLHKKAHRKSHRSHEQDRDSSSESNEDERTIKQKHYSDDDSDHWRDKHDTQKKKED